MTDQKSFTPIFKWALFLIFIIASHQVGAQCAGADSTVTVCDKDQDPSTRNFDLFSNLGGSPTAGGIWSTTDPANFFALNPNTGEVDLWRINNNGVHQFIYTNDTCGETATITINLGGYPGENNLDGSANACSDSLVNLHGFLGSEIDGKVQDFNGLWEEDPSTATGFLSNNLFDAFSAGPGVYIFTYTVSSVGSCPSRQSTVVLEVHPAPEPGIPSNLTVCINEDLSSYTNVDLNTYLSGEDLNGTWSESGTNQLSDLTDHEIDVQAINANFGYGTYTFRYTVYPSHPICTERFADVEIIILPVLDGTLRSPNFCSGTPYDIPFSYDSSMLPNGEYRIQYQINDSDGIQTDFDDAILNSGQGTLRVNPLLVSTNEFVALDIIGIAGINPTRDVCPNIIMPQTTFLVSDATATIVDVCPNTDITVTLANVLNATGTLSNETYNVDYILTDPDGNSSSFTAQNIGFTNGDANFDIPATNLTAAGTYNMVLDIPGSFDMACLNTSFAKIPAPANDIVLDLIVDNSCNATKIDVVIDAPILTSGDYTVTYEVTELNSTNILVNNTINFTGGTANYQIDLATLPQGDYTVALRSTQNDTTPCRTVFDFEQNENFAIGGIPEIPQAAVNQTFCTNDFGTNGPTLANIVVTASGTLSFFDTQTSSLELPITTVLVDGEDYFVTSTDPNNNCQSSEKVGITVNLVTPETAMTTNTSPTFCSSENATVANLNVSVSDNSTLVWYDAASGGNSISDSEILIDGKPYYAVAQINGTCESNIRLEMVPTVIRPETPNLALTSLALCGLNNPTVSELRNLENSNDVAIEWYDSPSDGSPLFDTDILENGTTYYAESYHADTGCINPERVAVTVDLTNCDPEDYGFFIPDGFSPNNDGRNDTFFIPNIEVIFPDFTLEILNRYGSSLFKGDKNTPSWDGDKAPNGVYFYVIDYNKEGFAPKQGRLYLNR